MRTTHSLLEGKKYVREEVEAMKTQKMLEFAQKIIRKKLGSSGATKLLDSLKSNDKKTEVTLLNKGFTGFNGSTYNPKNINDIEDSSLYSDVADIIFTFTTITSIIVLLFLFFALAYGIYKLVINNCFDK